MISVCSVEEAPFGKRIAFPGFTQDMADE